MRLDELEGRVIAGRFRLTQMVGKGGYGAVFEAVQLSVGRRCAVKILLPGRSEDEAVEKRFRIEARTTSRLTHPNSLVLYDFGVDDETGYLFLATEFLDGVTLHRRLQVREVLGVGRTLLIMEQVAASLDDAHGHDLVHRDVKPKNIMLVDRAGHPDFVKVIDFGIAKALGGELSEDTGLTRTGMLLGTPQYMAPEQLLGKSIDGRADQYALAVIGYRMLTGRNPFRAGAPMETAMRHINDRPLPLRTYRPELPVGEAFEAVFLRALEKCPDARYQTVGEFVQALTDVAGDGDRGAGDETEKEMENTVQLKACDEVVAVEPLPNGSSGGGQTPMADGDLDPTRSSPTRVPQRREKTTEDLGSTAGERTDHRSRKKRLRPPSYWALAAVVVSLSCFVAAALTVVWSGPSEDRSGAVTAHDEEPHSPPPEDEEKSLSDESVGAGEGVDEAFVAERRHAVARAVEDGRRRARMRADELETTPSASKPNASAEPRPETNPPPEPASVTVTLIPWGTLVVNGEPKSDATRQQLELPAGEHELALRQRGEIRASRMVDVTSGESKMVVLEVDFAR